MLDKVNCPIFIFQGTKDFLIHGDSNAQKLKDLYPNKITLIYITDALHNDIHITKQYYDALKSVLP